MQFRRSCLWILLILLTCPSRDAAPLAQGKTACDLISIADIEASAASPSDGNALTTSITAHGVLQPLLVRRHKAGYRVIAERLAKVLRPLLPDLLPPTTPQSIGINQAAAESAAGIYGMRSIASHLGSELKKLERSKFGAQAAA